MVDKKIVEKVRKEMKDDNQDVDETAKKLGITFDEMMKYAEEFTALVKGAVADNALDKTEVTRRIMKLKIPVNVKIYFSLSLSKVIESEYHRNKLKKIADSLETMFRG